MTRSQLARLLGLAGDLHLLAVDSPALAGNPLGDPSLREIPVYVPPGYDAGASARYSALYLLHGYAGCAAAQLAVRRGETNVVQRADRLIARGAMPPALLVVVDGATALGGSQYVDSPHNGAYATYVARDVVGAVDAAFRTDARAERRAVLGKSSGGFGSFHLALARPGVFGALGMHSADVDFARAYAPLFAHAQRALERYGGDLRAFAAAHAAGEVGGAEGFAATEALAMTAAYSPSGAAPYALDLPFDLRTGATIPEIFARWRAFDPIERVADGAAQLAALRRIYVDCGRRDEYLLDLGARVLVDRMRAVGLAPDHREFDGGHGATGHRYDVSLPLLAEAIAA